MERSFKRTFDSLQEIFGFIGEFFAGQAIDERHRYAVDLAVEELFTNMVKYNPGVPHDIQIGLERLDDHLAISLMDPDSEPFDPNRAGDAAVDRPIEERRPGGLGIHLVRKMMDRIDYEYTGRCSRTTLIKRLE